MALYALVAFHASRHEWRSALLWLDAVSRSAPSDPTPLAASGLLFLQIGDMVAASAATDAAEAACSVADAVLAEQGRAAVARNRALLRVAAKDYAVRLRACVPGSCDPARLTRRVMPLPGPQGARDAFAAALAARPWDAVAANNAAVAALYCADLPAAVDILVRKAARKDASRWSLMLPRLARNARSRRTRWRRCRSRWCSTCARCATLAAPPRPAVTRTRRC